MKLFKISIALIFASLIGCTIQKKNNSFASTINGFEYTTAKKSLQKMVL
jgi:hypothetical protein